MGKSKRRKISHPTPKAEKSSKPKAPIQPTIPFEPGDRILLVGEGDFSFAKSIVEEHGCYDVTATCYDAQSALFAKYDPQAEEHVKYLTDEGQQVHYSVDATKLDANKTLKKQQAYNVIIFNFPHVGGKSTDVNRQVRFNQELLVKFFTSAQTLLMPDGTIVVTLFEGEPYTLWNIRDLGRHAGLEVRRSFKFVAEAYPGYSHARTLGNIEGGGGWKGQEREARSYVFGKKAGTNDGQVGRTVDGDKMNKTKKSKKRGREEDISGDED